MRDAPAEGRVISKKIKGTYQMIGNIVDEN